MRAFGKRRTNSATTVRRSAASLSATSSRAAETSGEIAPPSTIMPSGAPRVASQRGKRSSSGMISALPAGERPRIASTIRLAKASARPARAKRVGSSNRPRMPIETTRLDGMAKKPRILERGKNIHRSLLLPRLLARLGVGVHGIEAGKLRPALDLADDKAFHTLVLGALLGDEGEEVLRDHHRPVVVADDDIAGKDGAAAAADRLLPADESEPVDGSRRGGARAPDRQLGGEHAGLVAHDAVGHQRRDVALHHAHGEDVAEDAGRDHAHRIGHGDATCRHFLDGAARRDRFRPAFRRREVLAHRHEAQRERGTHEASAAGNERLRPVHPATADAFLQQHGGDGCGGDRAQRVVKGRTHGTPLWETSLPRSQTGATPRRASRRRSQATNGIDSNTIHALPTIWPSRNSSEPKASHKKTTESTTSPTTPDATTAMRSPRRASGV